MDDAGVSVGVDLCQALDPILTEMPARLVHLLGRHGVVPGLTGGVRQHHRGHDTCVVAPVAIEKRDPLDARVLPGELIQQALPGGLRQNEVHLGLRSGVATGFRRAG